MASSRRTVPSRSPRIRFTVPEVWRTIVKKNERHGSGVFDVLVCEHAVEVDARTRENTYRRARACPTCRIRAQQYADEWRRAAAAAEHA